MSVVRVIVAGTVGAGKSTLVQTVGEIGSVNTEVVATDQAAILKPTTTAALDFSRVTIPETSDTAHTLHLYGTPGQYRFNFMWEILLQSAQLGLVLVAAHRPEDLPLTRQILGFIDRYSTTCTSKPLPLTIGLTHTDCAGALSIQDVSNELGGAAIVVVNPHDRASVIDALTIGVHRLFGSRR